MRLLVALICLLPLAACAALTATQQTVTVNGKPMTVKVVRASLREYQVKVGLAKGKVGATQPLRDIAQAGDAVAAINGSFFDAYTKETVKAPYHHLIVDGELAHLGNTGTTLGFDAEGRYRMESVKLRLLGQVAGKSWYAYFMNHPAAMSSAAILYSKFWVGVCPPNTGRQVMVEDGKVTDIHCCGATLPKTGYSLLFSGGESYLANRFAEGAACSFSLGVENGDADFWPGAQQALGCGPRLVKDGQLAVDPRAEGFSDPKILTLSCARSAVGLTTDEKILLVTCPTATIPQLAHIMKALGSVDAMNLDGGASSALWVPNRYLTPPGRDISNALLLVKR